MPRPDPLRAFRFSVEIDALLQAGFQSVSGLARESQIEPYHEGGENQFEHQHIVQSKYPPLVLKRGLVVDRSLWDWHQDVIAGNIVRRNITLILYDVAKIEKWRWICAKAFPSKWSGAELDATANSIATESVEFVHHGLTRQ